MKTLIKFMIFYVLTLSILTQNTYASEKIKIGLIVPLSGENSQIGEKIIKLKMIGASFSEVPFVLRYDQKQGSSKMVSSITTLGYIVMTVLYHWPLGGWRSSVKKTYATWKISDKG